MDTTLLAQAIQAALTQAQQTLTVNPSANPLAVRYINAVQDKLGQALQDAQFASTVSPSGTFISGIPGSPYFQ